MLGRILLSQLGRPAEAADAFALSQRLHPEGALAEDAMAREAEASLGSGDRQRATSLAKQYATRYPNGRYLATMQRMQGTLR
jgi:transmembrane sensor